MSTAPSTAPTLRNRLGPIGIWSIELRFGDRALSEKAIAELDELGFGAIWIPGALGGDILEQMGRALALTKRTTIASAIINIWKHEPAELGRWWHGLSDDHKSRTMLGLGASHAPLIEEYQSPLAKMTQFLDGLDAEGVASDHVCIAALAPKMLDLSGRRTAGTHPYLVTPAHSAIARAAVGPDKLVAPGQHCILESDPATARAIAREDLAGYQRLPNYVNNWRRLGFSEEDTTTASDRLVDEVVAWGGADVIGERVRQHHAAGADHVCLKVVTGDNRIEADPPIAAWRKLAEALL
jgi:probable F420-dependent oxidoreductase